MKIYSCPIIDLHEASEEIGVKEHYNYIFTEMAEDGSYQRLSCDEEHVEELKEEIEYAKKNSYFCYRAENELKLVNHLRENYNITDEVLVFVYW